MSEEHVGNLRKWPEKEEVVRIAALGDVAEGRITMIARWVEKYGPGPYVWDYATSREGIRSEELAKGVTEGEAREVQVQGWVRIGSRSGKDDWSSWNSEGENMMFEREKGG